MNAQVMSNMGNAMMGSGEAEGENRALHAAEMALANPLLGDISIKDAKGLLVNITGGSDLTLFEVDEAGDRVTKVRLCSSLKSTRDEMLKTESLIMQQTGIGRPAREHHLRVVLRRVTQRQDPRLDRRHGHRRPREEIEATWSLLGKEGP